LFGWLAEIEFPMFRYIYETTMYLGQASNLDLFLATRPNRFAETMSFLREF